MRRQAAHFRTLALGQGANTALPIWALYMQQVYADPSLNITKRDFDPPAKPLEVDFDCGDEENAVAFPNSQ